MDLPQTAQALLQTLEALATELHRSPPAKSLTLDSSLERDFGFDSLGRVELVLRLEQRFGVRLSEQVMATAETPRELLRAVLAGETGAAPAGTVETVHARVGAVEGEPADAGTLVEVLRWHVERHPERPHVYLLDDQGCRERIAYGELWRGAAAVASGLRARGIGSGDTVAIMLPTSREYFFGFAGILLAGGIPVPLYPPLRLAQIEDHLRRQSTILRNAGTALMITVPEAQRVAQLLKAQVTSLRHVTSVEELSAGAREEAQPSVNPQDIALLQYTSGSTGTPKGVILTHANLLANIRAMGEAVRASSEDVLVSWLPLYHDMGLIGAWLGSSYYAAPFVVMSPLTFLARPERWLRAITDYKGTISAGPNFGFELCVRKIDDTALAGLDLSSWRLAVNGAEPISPDTMTRFMARFAAAGFRPETMAPVYGLAESSVGLAFPPLGRVPPIDRIKRDVLTAQGRAEPADPDDPTALRFVACGRPLPGHQIRVVDQTGREVGDREVGRIQFTGPSTTSGYYRNPEATRALFDGEWLESGDDGYLAEGDIYITGRAKEVIIRAGRNLYPYELEEAVGAVPGIRKGCVAVFGTADADTSTERLVVVAETREADPVAREELRDRIRALAMDLLHTAPDDIVLAPPHAVLKTSSGKIRRAACRELYERGSLGKPGRAVWLQVARVALGGVLISSRGGLRTAGRMAYAAYAWAVFGAGITLALVGATVMPSERVRWRITRGVARLGLRLAGIPLVIRGTAPRTPVLFATNHASYLDAVVLAASLPYGGSFVAKRELASGLVARFFLRRLGTEFVERFDAKRSVEDTAKLVDAARRGRSLVVFPEGTFGRATGVRPFRMGAFVVAAQAGTPVVPVALRGTRSILRDGSWFPRRGAVSVVIGEPLVPQGKDWAAALGLREATRKHILQWSGEPDLLLARSVGANP
ncbi:MAG: AMP-binding protein [Nitrospirota bacterium]